MLLTFTHTYANSNGDNDDDEQDYRDLDNIVWDDDNFMMITATKMTMILTTITQIIMTTKVHMRHLPSLKQSTSLLSIYQVSRQPPQPSGL